MTRLGLGAAGALVALGLACSDGDGTVLEGPDARAPDDATADARGPDDGSAARDAAPLDVGPADAEPADGGRADAGASDASAPVACSANATCTVAGERCVRDAPAAPTDGTQLAFLCGTPVGPGGDGALCDANDECASGFCALAGGCVSPCSTDADCGADARCQRVFTPTGPDVMQFHRACVARIDAPPGVRVTPRAALGQSLRRRVATPVPLSLSFVHAAEVIYDLPLASRDGLAILQVDDDAGNVLFDTDEIGASIPASGVNPSANPLVFRYPNGPDAPPDARAFTLDMLGEQAQAFATKLERDAPGATLDLNLFYVGVAEGPEGDRGPPVIAQAIDAVERIYAPDVALGDVRQFEVVGAPSRRLDFIDGDGELGDLWSLSAGAGRPAINVFFVEDIGGALGISGGIPGPAVAHGTIGSGVAVALGFLRDDAEALGEVIAHEVGHHLGLFHTTELFGFSLEPLTDTPICTNDANGDGFFLPEECVDEGGANLMFWSGSGSELSRQQRDVMLNAMVLR
jgi:hypothetical protein